MNGKSKRLPMLRICAGCWSRGEHKAFTPDHRRHFYCNEWCFLSYIESLGINWRTSDPEVKKRIGDETMKLVRRMRRSKYRAFV
jgi:hypothetical protein